MIEPLVTVAFLTALWLAARILLELADGNLVKIVAALRGQSFLAEPSLSTRPVSVRFRPQVSWSPRPVAVQAEWRAAA